MSYAILYTEKNFTGQEIRMQSERYNDIITDQKFSYKNFFPNQIVQSVRIVKSNEPVSRTIQTSATTSHLLGTYLYNNAMIMLFQNGSVTDLTTDDYIIISEDCADLSILPDASNMSQSVGGNYNPSFHFTGALYQEYGDTLHDLSTKSTWRATLPINSTPVIFYDQPFFKGNVVLQLDMNYNGTFNSFNGSLKNVKSMRTGIHYVIIHNSYLNDGGYAEAMDIVYLPMIFSTHNIIEKIVVFHDDDSLNYIDYYKLLSENPTPPSSETKLLTYYSPNINFQNKGTFLTPLGYIFPYNVKLSPPYPSVTFYSEKNFTGDEYIVSAPSQANIFPGKVIKSIKIPNGIYVSLYSLTTTNSLYSLPDITFTADITDLSSYADFPLTNNIPTIFGYVIQANTVYIPASLSNTTPIPCTFRSWLQSFFTS